jgi:hypothetical protein
LFGGGGGNRTAGDTPDSDDSRTVFCGHIRSGQRALSGAAARATCAAGATCAVVAESDSLAERAERFFSRLELTRVGKQLLAVGLIENALLAGVLTYLTF